MRKLSKPSVVLAGVLGLVVALTGCAGEGGAADTAATGNSTTSATQSTEAGGAATGAASEKAGEPIELMVEKLQAKHYACADWKRDDAVEGATQSGTCNGEDQIMWFDSAEAVAAKRKELDEAGTAYVVGEDWIVANTITPTFVRNALGGEAVAAKG